MLINPREDPINLFRYLLRKEKKIDDAKDDMDTFKINFLGNSKNFGKKVQRNFYYI